MPDADRVSNERTNASTPGAGETPAPASRSLFNRANRVRLLLGAAVMAALGAMAFPKQVEDSIEIASRTINRIPRPAMALWYGHVRGPSAEALSLVRALNPGTKVCLVRSEIHDLVGDGWNADLIAEYAPTPHEPTIKCGAYPDAPRPAMAVFMQHGYHFNYAGTGGAADDPPSSWATEGRFILKTWAGTDNPFITIFYVKDGTLYDAHDGIRLTDSSEHEYELKTHDYTNGFIGWGVPEGIFHVEIGSDGKFVKAPGMPKGYIKNDSRAIVLNWDGTQFANLPSALPDGKTLKIPEASHLYVSGCETARGFSQPPELLGAAVPLFDQHPLLQCGGTSEDDETDIDVVEDDP